MAAGKNRGINGWRREALFGGLLLMLGSVFVSRGALSVSLVLFVGLALLHKDFVAQAATLFQTPFLFSVSLLFFVPAVSGLWSSDTERWSDVVRIKLPLVFLPLAFAGHWQLRQKQWQWLAVIFLLSVFGACFWSLMDYAQNAAQIHEGYLRAKTLRTPFENDHVRFSWVVSVAVIVCLLLREAAKQKRVKVLPVTLAVFFVAYLHVLSARTGLLSLYLFLAIYAVGLVKRMRKGSVVLLCTVVLLPVIAYLVLPTFRARIQYNLYDLSFVKKAEYLPGSSDGARVLSLKAGWQVLRQNPFGAGAGDVMHEADKWYAAYVPQVLPSDKFYPCSEWLVYGAFAGWAGVLLFTTVMLLPFFVKPVKHRIYWVGFHAIAAFSFVFDIGLEVQYGIFLYAFFACLFWKGLANVNTNETTVC